MTDTIPISLSENHDLGTKKHYQLSS